MISYLSPLWPSPSPLAGPAWPPPDPAVSPSAPRSPAPDEISSSPLRPVHCADGWTRLLPPETTTTVFMRGALKISFEKKVLCELPTEMSLVKNNRQENENVLYLNITEMVINIFHSC